GVMVAPYSAIHGWPLATFSLALASQNLLWGMAQPFAAAGAEKWGARRVGALGGLAYAAGLAVTAMAGGPGQAMAGAGLLIGLGLSATSFGVVLGVVGRATPPEKRSVALGIASAGGSFGQMAVVPLASGLTDAWGVVPALWALAGLALLAAPLSMALGEGRSASSSPAPAGAGPLAAVREAWAVPGFRLLTGGFFVCGFQLAFIGIHLPGYLTLCSMPAALGGTALAVIGAFNMVGSWTCGMLGQRWSPRLLLAAIYAIRGVVIALFVWLPASPAGVLVFAAVMGLLWLGTVPLTSHLIARLFGPRYMGTLFGVVFLGHQIGAFVGAWAGGALFDSTGSYDAVWWATAALGLVAALVHLPIPEHPQTAAAIAAAE
ncbi:MAG: MFS transporter, partial [Caulobacter sp.]|nr:MFS transporter [Caulobacter sp.]